MYLTFNLMLSLSHKPDRILASCSEDRAFGTIMSTLLAMRQKCITGTANFVLKTFPPEANLVVVTGLRTRERAQDSDFTTTTGCDGFVEQNFRARDTGITDHARAVCRDKLGDPPLGCVASRPTAEQSMVTSHNDDHDATEEARLRRWAREHYVPLPDRSLSWPGYVLDEMRRADDELPCGEQTNSLGACEYRVDGPGSPVRAPKLLLRVAMVPRSS